MCLISWLPLSPAVATHLRAGQTDKLNYRGTYLCLLPAAWNLDVMTGTIAAVVDHEVGEITAWKWPQSELERP